jgi:hypothetical protein
LLDADEQPKSDPEQPRRTHGRQGDQRHHQDDERLAPGAGYE